MNGTVSSLWTSWSFSVYHPERLESDRLKLLELVPLPLQIDISTQSQSHIARCTHAPEHARCRRLDSQSRPQTIEVIGRRNLEKTILASTVTNLDGCCSAIFRAESSCAGEQSILWQRLEKGYMLCPCSMHVHHATKAASCSVILQTEFTAFSRCIAIEHDARNSAYSWSPIYPNTRGLRLLSHYHSGLATLATFNDLNLKPSNRGRKWTEIRNCHISRSIRPLIEKTDFQLSFGTLVLCQKRDVGPKFSTKDVSADSRTSPPDSWIRQFDTAQIEP